MSDWTGDGHQCIDCKAEPPASVRKIVTPDGEPKRCTTHLRRFTTRQRQLKRGSHIERTYDISAADAGALLVYQGGRCAICGRATGASKLLAVEHDHADDWVRGRCCSTCNQFLTRQLGDDPAKAQNLVRYLSGDTPYRRMLAERLLGAGGLQPPYYELRVWADPGAPGTIVIGWNDANQIWNEVRTPLHVLKSYATVKGSK